MFQLTKCEHKGVSESTDSDDRSFSSVKPPHFFLNQNILFSECSKKGQTYISNILTLFEYISRIKIKNKFENEENLDLFSIFSLGLILYRMEQLFLCRFKRHFLTTYSPAGTEPVLVKSGKLMSCVNKTLSKGLLVH